MFTNHNPIPDDLASATIVLFVGNLVPVKGPDIALEAFAAAVSGLVEPDYLPAHALQAMHLIVIGDGPMRRLLLKRANELGIAERVSFLGARPHEEVALWMNVADCLLMTSRSEGCPNVVLEALASGLPVVAVAGCWSTKTFEVKDYSIMVESDIHSIARGVVGVLNRACDKRGGRSSVGRVASWQKTAYSILAHMGESMGSGTVACLEPLVDTVRM